MQLKYLLLYQFAVYYVAYKSRRQDCIVLHTYGDLCVKCAKDIVVFISFASSIGYDIAQQFIRFGSSTDH